LEQTKQKKKTRKIAFMMIYGDFISIRPVSTLTLPCSKMAALLTHSFQWTAVAKATSSVYVYELNSCKVDNSANDCNCRFRTEMATKRKDLDL